MKWPSARVVRAHAFDLLRYGGLGLCVYLVAHQFMRHSSGPKEGSAAAAFDLPLAGGTGRVSLAAHKGKPVLMEVFASWCGVCKRTAPNLVEAWRAHHGENVEFLAVSVDEDPTAASRVKQAWHLPFDVAIDDGSVSRGYGISMLPTLIYIDANGNVKHSVVGSTSRSELEDWIAER